MCGAAHFFHPFTHVSARCTLTSTRPLAPLTSRITVFRLTFFSRSHALSTSHTLTAFSRFLHPLGRQMLGASKPSTRYLLSSNVFSHHAVHCTRFPTRCLPPMACQVLAGGTDARPPTWPMPPVCVLVSNPQSLPPTIPRSHPSQCLHLSHLPCSRHPSPLFSSFFLHGALVPPLCPPLVFPCAQ